MSYELFTTEGPVYIHEDGTVEEIPVEGEITTGEEPDESDLEHDDA